MRSPGDAPPILPPLKAIQAFEQTARFGNVARAAELLDLTPSAVSHQLAKLEAMIGRQLFFRTARGVTLTPVGEQYLTEVSGILHSLAVATERATSDVSLDCLRLHSSPSFGLLWLMPRLEQFRQSHPDIQLNLSCSYESLHFSRDKIDVDIRHGMPNWPSYEVRTIRNEKMAVMASPKLLAKRPIRVVADLLDCNLILSEATLIKWPQLFAQHGLSRPEQPYTLSFDRSYMTLEAASHGLGFALESTLLARDYLARGALVEVAPELSASITAHHLVFPRAHSNFPRVRRFLEWMQKELGHDFAY
ncbi:LysR family transcriptional regulator [Pseudomonas sp. FW306-02-F02-AA]|jgi:DNA-binding transcriptional LysR family regulator|uniref:DNA-binding transcriptional LysR family regulator n=2 Tax=Pseudomonas TaxID=286 RepID=A0ACC5M8P9_9PSED|nr:MULTISPECIES: LysR substrate-binding domain-containing protein [Pseudomonas]URM27077.1 LysR family transcriptional regulator [Pseudomonas frederiksbergensis]ALI04076.1 LysR family transcriptional regulator [Pseudomonas fluorescens]MBB2885039.1 DNA-binding transcriptional LysR family regulator [Pseudomonas umsongensis]MDZ5436785.1 LysR substrate-binding domain-containing protein [Pseudomonas fluorescens]NMN74684.1 LysR family transcriptional regulator [Pseudomonas sp. KD5]